MAKKFRRLLWTTPYCFCVNVKFENLCMNVPSEMISTHCVCGLLESLLLYKSKPTIACLHIIKTQLSLTHPGSNMVNLCKIKLSLKRGKIPKCWNLDLSNN